MIFKFWWKWQSLFTRKGNNIYSINLFIPEGKDKFYAEYLLNVFSNAVPSTDVTPTLDQLDVKIIEGKQEGINVELFDWDSGFFIEVDRSKLTSNNVNFRIYLSGRTLDGIDFYKNIFVHVYLEGDVGKATENVNELLKVELSDIVKTIPTQGTTTISYEIQNNTEGQYELFLYDNENGQFLNENSSLKIDNNNCHNR